MLNSAHSPLMTNSALDALPLYADDDELAVAIVGKKRAAKFKPMMTALERRGFPKKCPLHGGRSVFLIKLYYTAYFYPERQQTEYRATAIRDAEDDAKAKEKWEEAVRVKEARKSQKKANSEAWAEKKRKALEEFRAKKAAETDEG